MSVAMSIVIDLKDGECYRDDIVLAEGEFGSLGMPALRYECLVSKREDHFHLKIDYEISMVLPCARCLKESKYEDRTEIEVRCSNQVEDEEEEEYLLRIAKGKVDILEPMIQDITLHLPMAPLCKEDCQGICPDCGRDRPCTCENRSSSPFSILTGYFSKNKEE